jgi:hypothetical protein
MKGWAVAVGYEEGAIWGWEGADVAALSSGRKGLSRYGNLRSFLLQPNRLYSPQIHDFHDLFFFNKTLIWLEKTKVDKPE